MPVPEAREVDEIARAEGEIPRNRCFTMKGVGVKTRTVIVTRPFPPRLPQGGNAMSNEPVSPAGVDDLNDELAEVRELLSSFNDDVNQLLERKAA